MCHFTLRLNKNFFRNYNQICLKKIIVDYLVIISARAFYLLAWVFRNSTVQNAKYRSAEACALQLRERIRGGIKVDDKTARYSREGRCRALRVACTTDRISEGECSLTRSCVVGGYLMPHVKAAVCTARLAWNHRRNEFESLYELFGTSHRSHET